jgi:hypothetical protein
MIGHTQAYVVNNLDALGNLGDFIGGIAVVITLIYLALQVRQNTAALRTASRQTIVAGYREHVRLGLHPGLDKAVRAGLSSYTDLPQEEQTLFDVEFNDHTLFFQSTFALHEAGTLEDETYNAYLDFFAACILTPGGTEWWAIGSPFYPKRMVAAVNERIERGDLPDLRTLPGFVPPAE